MSGTSSKETSSEEGLFKCKYCGATESEKWGKFDQPWKVGNHVKYECEEFKKFKAQQSEKPEAKGEVGEEFPKKPSLKDFEPEELVAFYGEQGLEMLMEQRLRVLLDAPGVGAKSKKWIMAQWESDETVRRDFERLYSLLTDAGVSNRVAYRIVNSLVALDEKYTPTLQQYPPLHYRRRTPGAPRPYFGSGGRTEWPPYQRFSRRGERRYADYGYPEEQHYTREDLDRARREERTVHRIEKVESSTAGIGDDIQRLEDKIPRLIRDNIPKEEAKGQVEIEEVPVDAEGNPTDPKNAVTIKRITRPITEKRESFMDTFKQLKEMDVIITAEKLESIIEKTKPSKPPGESPDVAALKERVGSQEAKIEKMEADTQKEREERLKGTIDNLSGEVETLRAEIGRGPHGEYSADEYKYLDTITREAAARRPLEVVVNFGRDMFGLGGTTPGRPAADGSRGRIIKKLRDRQLTVPE